jgi:hypothetical protein
LYKQKILYGGLALLHQAFRFTCIGNRKEKRTLYPMGRNHKSILIFLALLAIGIPVCYAQLPEVKPSFLADSIKPKKLVSKLIDTNKANLPPDLFILEKPSKPRVAFANGSPICFYSFKDRTKYEGYVGRINQNGFYLTTLQGADAIIDYQDVRKIIIPRTNGLASKGKLLGSALVVAGIGYMALYALNPGTGNSIDPNKSVHARNSIYISSTLVTSGIILYWLGRDQRVRPKRGWKLRLDNNNPYYWPQIQK